MWRSEAWSRERLAAVGEFDSEGHLVQRARQEVWSFTRRSGLGPHLDEDRYGHAGRVGEDFGELSVCVRRAEELTVPPNPPPRPFLGRSQPRLTARRRLRRRWRCRWCVVEESHPASIAPASRSVPSRSHRGVSRCRRPADQEAAVSAKARSDLPRLVGELKLKHPTTARASTDGDDRTAVALGGAVCQICTAGRVEPIVAEVRPPERVFGARDVPKSRGRPCVRGSTFGPLVRRAHQAGSADHAHQSRLIDYLTVSITSGSDSAQGAAG